MAVGYFMLQLGPKSQQITMVNRVHFLFDGGDHITITFAPLCWVILTAIGEPLFLVLLFNVEASCLIIIFIMTKVSVFALLLGLGYRDWLTRNPMTDCAA